jgi:hypothetical protein
MDSIAIIVLNWNTPKLTIDTVNSLLKVKHPNFTYKIFIIDNNSTDNSITQFRTQFKLNPAISIHPTGSNLGYVEGNNFGIKLASKFKFDFTLIINSDVIVKPDFLHILHSYLVKNSQYAMVGPKIYFAPGFEFHRDRYQKADQGKVIWSYGSQIDWQNVYGSNIAIDEVDIGQFDKNNSLVDYLSGCCLLIRQNVLKQIGSFDKKYFMYLEDADFSQRLLRSGHQISCIAKSVIWHLNSGSSGRGAIHDYFLSRNRLLFGFRYASLRTKFALLKDSIKIFLSSPYVWQRYGVRDYYLNKLEKGSWQ